MYSTRTFVIPVLLFTVLYNVPKFFELTLEHVPVDHVVSGNETLNQTLEKFDWDTYDGDIRIDLVSNYLISQLTRRKVNLNELVRLESPGLIKQNKLISNFDFQDGDPKASSL